MLIYILNGYRGSRTKEQYLPVGAHDVPDDLAAYLVTNGHARLANEPAPVIVPSIVLDEQEARAAIEQAYIERESAAQAQTFETDNFEADTPEWEITETESAPAFDAMTVDDLTELADSLGLEVIGTGAKGKVLKADLIRALEQHNA